MFLTLLYCNDALTNTKIFYQGNNAFFSYKNIPLLINSEDLRHFQVFFFFFWESRHFQVKFGITPQELHIFYPIDFWKIEMVKKKTL